MNAFKNQSVLTKSRASLGITDNEPNSFHPKSLWTPPTDRDDSLNAFHNAVKNDLLTTKTQAHP